ncbi:MAG: translation initiation factor IF-3 [Candidatus Phytoplasma asteris]|uniref:Translation initiation factor IF-3 n=1 Tax='Chrysanthemum coronarium' phytoplasma TaxID=1520703 RepID=A0ABQ0J1T2_9MOLU|nr:translation initiation factor IF-3 ['Chrysanthemum coronarium' phytoplasma]TKA87744.1 MAG: translation initiation factor IF-3 [Periwinkle leaf yellowing phytoplasma]WEX20108.1 MAG: translation initiation factor IF-3 [Candidatus Phytoplasma asteris]GAK73571.1 translation initiation factor IF3 ['Chrysanthemum coronarium' phytoplasma]
MLVILEKRNVHWAFLFFYFIFSFFLVSFSCYVISFHFYKITPNLKEVLNIKINKFKKSSNSDLYNENIPQGKYLIIDEKGEQLGVFDQKEALKLSEQKEIDIVVVNADASPMVARLMNYQKHRYNQQKKLREAKKKTQIIVLKEIRLNPTIDKNDLNTKIKQAQKFLKQGDKVKVSMRFRGRMINNFQLGETVFKQVMQDLKNLSQIETPLKLQGNQLTAVLSPLK